MASIYVAERPAYTTSQPPTEGVEPPPVTRPPEYAGAESFDEYFRLCELWQETKAPGESPTPPELVQPFVDELIAGHTQAGANGEREQQLLDMLLGAYTPRTGNSTVEILTDHNASGALVGQTLYRTQQWALAHAAEGLSQRLVRLACGIIAKDANHDSPPNWWASETLRTTLEHQMPSWDAQVADPKHPQESLGFELIADNDLTPVHDALAYSLRKNVLDMSNPTIVDFLFKYHTLDTDVFLFAWRTGYLDREEATPAQMKNMRRLGVPLFTSKERTRQHLLRIEELEDPKIGRPGIAQRLYRNNGLRCLLRYSTELLLEEDGATPRHRGSSDNPYPVKASQTNGTYDHNSAFAWPQEYDDMRLAAHGLGHRITFVECGSRAEFIDSENSLAAKHPEIEHKAYAVHSNGTALTFSADSRNPQGYSYRIKDAGAEREDVSQRLANVATIALAGCRGGIKGGIAEALAELSNARVMGLSHNMGVVTEYGKEGFTMHNNKQSVPAGVVSFMLDGIVPSVLGIFGPRVKSLTTSRTWEEGQAARVARETFRRVRDYTLLVGGASDAGYMGGGTNLKPMWYYEMAAEGLARKEEESDVV